MADRASNSSSSRGKSKIKYKKSSNSRTKLEGGEEETMGKHKTENVLPVRPKEAGKEKKPKGPKRERWLLTRKTWRYMADAGRRLIPEGALNRPEDVPKIEAYFQQVCQREPRFLLWRKQSYPGAIGFRPKGRSRGGRLKKSLSVKDKTSSADEADDIRKTGGQSSETFQLQIKHEGKFDLKKLKEDFLFGRNPIEDAGPSRTSEWAGTEHLSKPSQDVTRKPCDVEVTTEPTNKLPIGHEKRISTLFEADLPIKPERHLGAKTKPTIEPERHLGAKTKPTTEPEKQLGARPKTKLNTESAKNQITKSKSSGNVENISKSGGKSDDGKLLFETLKVYLKDEGKSQSEKPALHVGGIDHNELLEKLRMHLDSIESFERTERQRQLRFSGVHFEGDHFQKMLLETLRRHYSKSTSREKVISDLLTDRKLLEKLHFDLRRARGFCSPRRGTGAGTGYSGYSPRWSPWGNDRETYKEEDEDEEEEKTSTSREDVTSPPPTIEIQEIVEKPDSYGTQTEPISAADMVSIEEEIRKQKQSKVEAEAQEVKEQQRTGHRRTSVTDNDDVSPSVSDTIKRYLRMARKKSLDSDKERKFNTVNYDRNLRYIKSKGGEVAISDDVGFDKGIQTDESWVAALKELKLEDIPDDPSRLTSSRSSIDTEGTLSPPTKSPSSIFVSGQNFLSNLLHGQKNRQVTSSSVPLAAQAMQKSKSSSSVVHHGSRLVAKKIWKARSKSSSRATPSVTSVWTPQGNCVWTNVTGKSVTLSDTSLLNLTEIERKVLQKVALAKLQALNLGVNIRIPSDCVPATSVQKPKRRAYLIKRKALTTSIFDTKAKDDKDKGEGTNTGAVFGMPLVQCVENERAARMGSRNSDASGADEHSELRRKSHHGSRGSFSSLIDYANKQEERGSCESLSPTLSMPGMLDNLSCSSALDLTSEHSVVPYVVSSCLRYLETNGLHTLGIFRVSSSKKRVRQLREDFDSGKEICLDDELCPHDVATLLKEYFRDLPDALLCKDLYQAFIQTQKIRNRRLQHEAIKHLLQLLPVANRDTLWALLGTLSTIALNSGDHKDLAGIFTRARVALLGTLSTIALNSGDHKDLAGEWVSGNKMDSNNLATLFAPNILHSCPKASAVPSKDELSAERTEERSDAINVIRSLIDSYRSFFQVPAEILDEVYVHMMDSHPEVLDQLLLRRELANDDLQDDPENSVVSEDTAPTERLQLPIDSQESLLSTSSDDRGGERRVWSREAFTHEHAGMGGPDVEMKPRKERDRTRERITKKRWKDEPTGRRRLDSGGGSSTASRRTSTTYQDDGRYYSSAETSGQQTPDDQMAFSDRSMDFGVVTGSLKIPVPASTSFTLNLDDADIPFIEDTERQQMTFGVLRSSSSSQRMSGSDSSQASTYIHQIHYPAQSDSAVGSSGGVSSPPRNTSVSSFSSGGVFSSPPSWASSPPTSPDHSISNVNYLPEETTTARMIIPTKKSSEPQQRSVILQRVTIKTGETQPGTIKLEQTSSPSQERRKSKDYSIYQRFLPGVSDKLAKSASSTTVINERTIPIVKDYEQTPVDKAITPSISNIGGAVLRSKTEDIERMIRLQNASKQMKKAVPISEEKSKRRYAETRHQARIIPITTETEAAGSSPGSSEQRKSGVWKRREIISSEPKDRKGVGQ